MGNDMLSQDEIDALLRGTDEGVSDTSIDQNLNDFLSEMEKDALGEIGNISFGSSATALSTLLNQKVDITTPEVTVIMQSKLVEEFSHPYVAIQVRYTEGFSGTNLLVIQQKDAAIIADLMLGGNGQNPNELMDEIQMSAVQEAMNQMMGSAATSMSTIFSKRVDISPPSIDILDVQQGEGTDKIPDDDMFVKVSFRLKIGNLIDSNIMQLLQLHFAKSLVEELLNPKPEIEKNNSIGMETILENQYVERSQSPNNSVEHTYPNQTMDESFPQKMQQQPYAQESYPFENIPYQNQMPLQGMKEYHSEPQHFGSPFPQGIQPNVQPAVFSNFEPYQLQESEARNLDMLMDIPLQVTVELGRTKRSVKEILELTPGSIVELDKLAGEPVDILVNNRPVARGEVVVIDENFGVRVTDIISKSDRIKKLK
jgi:flagellar motor switch protein FliN